MDLKLAVEALYRAGRWVARGVHPEASAKLWEDVRDAAGLVPGLSEPAKPGEDEMQEANNLVNGDRQADYGTPRGNYEGVAKVWSGLLSPILKRDITPEEAALMMVGLKLQRQAMKHKRDNLVDAHGYLLVYSHIKAAARQR